MITRSKPRIHTGPSAYNQVTPWSFGINRDELNNVIANAHREEKCVELKHEFDPHVLCLELSVREEGYWHVPGYIQEEGGYVGCPTKIGPESIEWARVSTATPRATIANRLTTAEQSDSLVIVLFDRDNCSRLVKHRFYTTEGNYERVMYCHWVNEHSLECDTIPSRIPLSRLVDVIISEIPSSDLTECPSFRDRYANLVLPEFDVRT